MIIVKPDGAAPCHRSEREFLRAIHDHPGVYLANLHVPNSIAPGAFTREVDGVMLTPHGIYTCEVKGVRATGDLRTPRMDAWSIGDGPTRVTMQGRPHAQALAHSKYLASFLKEAGAAPGWITAVLAIVGDGITLPDEVPVHVTDNVHVVLSQPGVVDLLRAHTSPTGSQREVSVELVQRILSAFECTDAAPDLDALMVEGFRTDAQIEAEVQQRRDQARAEHLAAAAQREPAAVATGSPDQSQTTGSAATEAPDACGLGEVAQHPSTAEWRITSERYAATVALDEELSETGAFVDGVPMHRRLLTYAARKNVALSEVAAVVNDPDEVLGGPEDANLIYCGGDFAVSVRNMDGLALFYKPVTEARAERDGVTLNGVQISARAAKHATNQFNLSLDAVTRIVTAPEERWWVPGTTDIAHARGDFVAVTSGHHGQVQYLQTRAMAVSRAQPKDANPTEESTPAGDVDTVVGDLTIRASAVGWCNRRKVDLSTIAETAAHPSGVWPGHSENMEVRSGATYAVLFDKDTASVVAVMSPEEAIDYRDGIVKDGVRISGRCLFLSKRRKVSIDDLVTAYRAPGTIARQPGVGSSVYIGAEIAVTVCDDGNVLTDFTFAGHARALIRRGELVDLTPATETETEVSPSGSVPQPVPTRPTVVPLHAPRAPSPAMLDAARRTGPRPAATGRDRAPAGVPVGTPSVSPLAMPRRVPRSA